MLGIFRSQGILVSDPFLEEDTSFARRATDPPLMEVAFSGKRPKFGEDGLDSRLQLCTETGTLKPENATSNILTSCSINICGALSGAFFIFTYAALFLESVGTFSNSIQVSVIINACLFAGLCFGPFLMDLIGRRWLILSGYLGMMSCMVIFAAVSSGLGSESDVVHDVLVPVAYLCRNACHPSPAACTSVQHLRVQRVRLRHKLLNPYMLDAEYGNMGTNVGYFYFGTELVAFALLFFILPENALLTLEQIDEYFMSGRKPWKTSLRRNKRIARGEIGVGDD
ncbi:hypothetical protein BJX66DRAFT_342484 [Aspergillus keveii]|uniref:Uncharacterized protein n=1 Tax=Aspergillus keveii TaxID=714993 RepID=A0ABR4FS51_9EURO